MDAFNGITLDRYAQLSAVVGDTQDPAAQAQLVAAEGVAPADWEAAKAGWTARMQDMSDMGQTATRYMSLYNGYLAQRGGGATEASFEDFVAMSAVIKARGYEGMIATYGISQSDWTQIAGHWNNTMAQNMGQYGHFHGLVEQECQRVLAGGEPKPVSVGKGRATGAAAAAAPAAAPMMNQAANFGAQAQGAYQAGQGMGLGSMLKAVGGAVGMSIGVGTHVLVQWNDGNKYPGTVIQDQPGQYCVSFPDGRQMWIPEQYVERR